MIKRTDYPVYGPLEQGMREDDRPYLSVYTLPSGEEVTHRDHVCEYGGIIVARDAVRHFSNAWCTLCGEFRYAREEDVAGALWFKGEVKP